MPAPEFPAPLVPAPLVPEPVVPDPVVPDPVVPEPVSPRVVVVRVVVGTVVPIAAARFCRAVFTPLRVVSLVTAPAATAWLKNWTTWSNTATCVSDPGEVLGLRSG